MTSRSKRPIPSTAHPTSAGGNISIENEIERSRETERWERVIERADQLRLRPDKASVLADFLVGEAKLEEYMKLYPTPNAARKKLSTISGSSSVKAEKLIGDAELSLKKATGEDGKKLGVHLDSFILLGKLYYIQGEYVKALDYYDKAQLEILEEKTLPPRSLKIMAEAFAIKAVVSFYLYTLEGFESGVTLFLGGGVSQF